MDQAAKCCARADASFMSSASTFDFNDPRTIHDRVLLVEGSKFYVKSGYIVVWSEFFRGLFESLFQEKNESEIELKDITADEFHVFLRLIYPGFFKVQASHITSLIDLSNRFLAPHVLAICTQFIYKEFDKMDKIELYIVAAKYDMETLKKRSMKFIFDNVESLNWIVSTSRLIISWEV